MEFFSFEQVQHFFPYFMTCYVTYSWTIILTLSADLEASTVLILGSFDIGQISQECKV